MFFYHIQVIAPVGGTNNRHLVAPFYHRPSPLCGEQVNIFWHELLSHYSLNVFAWFFPSVQTNRLWCLTNILRYSTASSGICMAKKRGAISSNFIHRSLGISMCTSGNSNQVPAFSQSVKIGAVSTGFWQYTTFSLLRGMSLNIVDRWRALASYSR